MPGLFNFLSTISFRILIEKMLPVWILIVIGLLIIPGLIETVKAGNRMTKSIRGAHMIGLRLSTRLRG